MRLKPAVFNSKVNREGLLNFFFWWHLIRYCQVGEGNQGENLITSQTLKRLKTMVNRKTIKQKHVCRS